MLKEDDQSLKLSLRGSKMQLTTQENNLFGETIPERFLLNPPSPLVGGFADNVFPTHKSIALEAFY